MKFCDKSQSEVAQIAVKHCNEPADKTVSFQQGNRRGRRSRLPARSVLLHKNAEVSTGHPHPRRPVLLSPQSHVGVPDFIQSLRCFSKSRPFLCTTPQPARRRRGRSRGVSRDKYEAHFLRRGNQVRL